MDDLTEDQKKMNLDNYMKLCLDSFSKTRNGVVQKSQFPTPSVMETPLDELSSASGSQTFQETINDAVHHALVNQSRVLINTLTNLIKQVAGGPPEQQAGPTYFSMDPLAPNYRGKGVQGEEPLLPKMPPPIPSAQQQPSGQPFTIPHPMSGYPHRPPSPPSNRYQQISFTQGGHRQPMPILTNEGHQHQTPPGQPIRNDQHPTNNRQYYAPDVPKQYFQAAGY